MSDEENAVSPVRGADATRRYTVPFRIIPERGKLSEYNVESSSKESCDVLHDDIAGSKLANDSGVLSPEPRSLTADSCSLARVADVLTRESATNHVHGWKVVCANLAHVGKSFGVRPMLREHGEAVRGLLDLPHRLAHARPFKPHLKTADTGEQ